MCVWYLEWEKMEVGVLKWQTDIPLLVGSVK
jgi:hypothetical protein